MKISNPEGNDYEVPIELNKPNTRAKNPKYEIEVDENDDFNFRIKRSSTKTVV